MHLNVCFGGGCARIDFARLAHAALTPPLPQLPLRPCSAAMAVLRQQLTFVHELYESGACLLIEGP